MSEILLLCFLLFLMQGVSSACLIARFIKEGKDCQASGFFGVLIISAIGIVAIIFQWMGIF
jgi:hypothetical protein